jgi:hypothetical protein
VITALPTERNVRSKAMTVALMCPANAAKYASVQAFEPSEIWFPNCKRYRGDFGTVPVPKLPKFGAFDPMRYSSAYCTTRKSQWKSS